MAGPRWLVAAVIQELLQLRYRDQLVRAVDLAIAIFHFDMFPCTVDLLAHALPQQLQNCPQADVLGELQLSSLAKLASSCVYASCDLINASEEPGPPPTKILRVSETSNLTDVEQVMLALRQLFSTLEMSIQGGTVTQQTYFAFHLLKCLVDVTSPSNAVVLGAIPSSLITDLLRVLPELFNPALLIRLHDLNTTIGRASVAKDLCMLRNYQLKKTFATR